LNLVLIFGFLLFVGGDVRIAPRCPEAGRTAKNGAAGQKEK
jgi:hypothetical protein